MKKFFSYRGMGGGGKPGPALPQTPYPSQPPGGGRPR